MAGSVITRLLAAQGSYVDLTTNQVVSGTKVLQLLQTPQIPSVSNDVINKDYHDILASYSSGIGTLSQWTQTHLAEVESYASGTAGTGGGDATAVTTYASGIETMRQSMLPNVRCFVTHSGTQSIAQSAVVTVLYETKVYETIAGMAIPNGILIPQDGFYNLFAYESIRNDGTLDNTGRSIIIKVGSDFAVQSMLRDVINSQPIFASTPYYCTSGQVITCALYQLSSAPKFINSGAGFSAWHGLKVEKTG